MRVWQQERAIFEITERICELMAKQGISRADLAGRLCTTRGYISQLLDGTRNMTIRTVSDVYFALDRQFHAEDRAINVRNGVEPVEQASKAIGRISADCIATALAQTADFSEERLAA